MGNWLILPEVIYVDKLSLGSTIQNFQFNFSPSLHFLFLLAWKYVLSTIIQKITYKLTQNNLHSAQTTLLHTYTKDLTIDIQDPGHTLFPTEIQYTRTSDDIRICDFTCLPNLNIAETKNKPTPNSIYDAMRNWLNCNFFGPILLKSERKLFKERKTCHVFLLC